jgi:hypothetical protein
MNPLEPLQRDRPERRAGERDHDGPIERLFQSDVETQEKDAGNYEAEKRRI